MVRANVGQEQAHNSLLLLNVVRAYHRMPMHFTRVKTVRLPLGVGNPTFTIPTPFGPDFTTQIYNFGAQIGVTQSVDSEVMDSQEFMRGITTPVKRATLLYYLDQGWPKQMILRLFIRSIEIYAPCQSPDDPNAECLVDRLENYPQNPDVFSRFQEAVEGMTGCEIDASEETELVPFGPPLASDRIGDVSALAAAKKESLEILAVDDTGKPTSRASAQVGFRLFKPSSVAKLRFSLKPFGRASCIKPEVTAARTTQSKAEAGKRTAAFVLRSPEAMLYHLGELARAQLGEVGTPARSDASMSRTSATFGYGPTRADVHPARATLFGLQIDSAQPAAISVDYEGRTYSVPKPSSSDRSMHVLSLLTQLFGLHNKADANPVTGIVRVVP